MPYATIFVQQPDYVGFRTNNLPAKALGAVYDGRDPYATPLGVIVAVLEGAMAREIFVPRSTHAQNGRIAYMHDLQTACYIERRNGFELAHISLGDDAVSDESKEMLRNFFEAQNTKDMNERYFIDSCG